jgi:predicted transcriptional regulator
MREELQQMANKLNMSVSEVLRNSMQTFQNIINQGTNPTKSPITNEKNTYNDNMTRNPGSMSQPQQSLEVKDQMKRRVKGLLRVHKNQIPINKLAGAMNLSDAEAENIIYELVADDKINGTIENNVFSYSNPVEEVISGLEKIIDQL